MAQTDQERQTSLVLVTVILTSVSAITVSVRTIVRFFLIRNPGMDDYTIIVALIFTIGYMLEVLLNKESRIGFPASTLTANMMTRQLQLTLAIEATYYMIVGSIKTSIIYLYLRFAMQGIADRFRLLCHGTIIFQIVFTATCLGVTFGQCSPLHKMWDLTGSVPGSCINTTAFFYSASSINIVTDLWILALPIKTLKLVNRPKKEKFALVVIFGAGMFATIISVVRLRSIETYTNSTDPFREAIAINIWSMLEVNTAILCASVPALKPVFTPQRIRDFRRRNKFQLHVAHDDPLDVDRKRSGSGSGSSSGGGIRKPSNASLYPDLEVEIISLTKVSRSRSPPPLPMRCEEDHGLTRPPRVVEYGVQFSRNVKPFDLNQRQGSTHPI